MTSWREHQTIFQDFQTLKSKAFKLWKVKFVKMKNLSSPLGSLPVVDRSTWSQVPFTIRES